MSKSYSPSGYQIIDLTVFPNAKLSKMPGEIGTPSDELKEFFTSHQKDYKPVLLKVLMNDANIKIAILCPVYYSGGKSDYPVITIPKASFTSEIAITYEPTVNKLVSETL